MNYSYIELINAFEKWLETNYLPSSAQLLWYKLIHIFNRAGWCEWVAVDNYRLMALVDIRREATLISLRDKLIDSGLFEYQKGKKGSPNKYKICTFNFVSINSSENRSINSSENSSINRSHIKTKTKTKIEKEIHKEKATFKPPTLDEVKQYCSEKDLSVNAEKFYAYFSEGNWIDSKGNKVKNWKQKLLTWNGFDNDAKKTKKEFNEYEQRADIDFEKYYTT